MDLPINYDQSSPAKRRQARIAYVIKQEGLCCHCQAPLTGNPSPEIMARSIRWEAFPPGFQRWPVHLHHNHRTGTTIGAVHNRCNAVLWQYHGQ